MVLDKIFKNSKGEFIDFIDVFTRSSNAQNYIFAIAEAHAIDLIAKTIAKTELLVYEKDKNKKNKIKSLKNDIYYYLNVQPNYNQTGTDFMYKLALKLLTEQETLILINSTNNCSIAFSPSNGRFCGAKRPRCASERPE